MTVEPIPPARTWHLILRGKVLCSGDHSTVLLARAQLPDDKRAKSRLVVGTLERRPK